MSILVLARDAVLCYVFIIFDVNFLSEPLKYVLQSVIVLI